MMYDWDSLTADSLKLIHFADVAMTTRPPDFDFAVDGEHAQKLVDVMHEAREKYNGLGLSANQVGLPFRMFVFGKDDTKHEMFNPHIVGASKETTLFREGCLSFPGFFLTLARPASVVVSYQDVTGTVQTAQFDGVGARVILHEYDHMEGLNFTNHASHFKLEYEFKKWKNQYNKQLKKVTNVRRR